MLDFLEHMRYQLSAQIPLGKLLLETSEHQSDHIGTDEPDDGGVVGEDAYDPGPAFDLLVDPLQAVGAPDLADGRSPHAAAPVTPNPTTTWDAYQVGSEAELQHGPSQRPPLPYRQAMGLRVEHLDTDVIRSCIQVLFHTLGHGFSVAPCDERVY